MSMYFTSVEGALTLPISSSVRTDTDREAEDGNIFFQPIAMQYTVYQ